MGQSLEELRKQKEKTASEIEFINNLLKETNSNAKASHANNPQTMYDVRLLPFSPPMDVMKKIDEYY